MMNFVERITEKAALGHLRSVARSDPNIDCKVELRLGRISLLYSRLLCLGMRHRQSAQWLKMSTSKDNANNPRPESVGMPAAESTPLVRLNITSMTTPATLAVTL